MTGYLDHVVRRGSGDVPTVLPRPRTRYEPGGDGWEESAVETAPSWPTPARAVAGAPDRTPLDSVVARTSVPLATATASGLDAGRERSSRGRPARAVPASTPPRPASPDAAAPTAAPEAVDPPGRAVREAGVDGGVLHEATDHEGAVYEATEHASTDHKGAGHAATGHAATDHAATDHASADHASADHASAVNEAAVHEVEMRAAARRRRDPAPTERVAAASELASTTRPGPAPRHRAGATSALVPAAADSGASGPDLTELPSDRSRPDRAIARPVAAPSSEGLGASDVPIDMSDLHLDVLDAIESPDTAPDTAPDSPPGPRTRFADPDRAAATAPSTRKAWRPPSAARTAGPDKPSPTSRRQPGADDRPPTVTVTIGRIEVRRPDPALLAPVPEPVPAPPQPLSLSDYLDQRGRT